MSENEPLWMRYIEEDSDYEVCPECGLETFASRTGTSSCEHCNHPNVLPCGTCIRDGLCDWDKVLGCKPFPKGVFG